MADQFDEEDGINQTDQLIPLNRKEKPKKSVAVSLKYDLKTDDVPEITAAGRGKIAEKILQIALENSIPVREDGTLAEMLAAIEIDSPIPSEAFMAVAEILSYVYQANGTREPFEAVLRDDTDDKEEPAP